MKRRYQIEREQFRHTHIEDQFRSALAVLEGLAAINPAQAAELKTALDTQLSAFLASLLKTESGIATGKDGPSREKAEAESYSLRRGRRWLRPSPDSKRTWATR